MKSVLRGGPGNRYGGRARPSPVFYSALEVHGRGIDDPGDHGDICDYLYQVVHIQDLSHHLPPCSFLRFHYTHERIKA